MASQFPASISWDKARSPRAASSNRNYDSDGTPTRTAVNSEFNSQLDLSKTATANNNNDITLTNSSSREPRLSNTPTAIELNPRPHYFNTKVNTKHLECIVVAMCFITGLTDSAMFSSYSIFTSMQSGNTIFLGLAASGQTNHPFVWVRVLFSLIAYISGVFLFSRLHDTFLAPKTRRLTLATSLIIQAILIIVAASVIQSGIVGRYSFLTNATSPREQWDSLVPICLLSFGAGGQIMAARSMGVPEVPTVVVTTMLCELWSDPKIFIKSNPGRDRRVAAFILMLLGAITGGWVDKASGTVQAALWLSAGLKFVCVAAVCFWKPESPERTVEGDEKV